MQLVVANLIDLFVQFVLVVLPASLIALAAAAAIAIAAVVVVAANFALAAAEAVLAVFEQAIGRRMQDMSLEFVIAKRERQVLRRRLLPVQPLRECWLV